MSRILIINSKIVYFCCKKVNTPFLYQSAKNLGAVILVQMKGNYNTKAQKVLDSQGSGPLKVSKKGKIRKHGVFPYIGVIKISFSVIFNKEIHALIGFIFFTILALKRRQLQRALPPDPHQRALPPDPCQGALPPGLPRYLRPL